MALEVLIWIMFAFDGITAYQGNFNILIFICKPSRIKLIKWVYNNAIEDGKIKDGKAMLLKSSWSEESNMEKNPYEEAYFHVFWTMKLPITM